MAIPQVALVGRPNVGKSALFNWLAGRRIAIVDPTAGVTRDRLTTPVQMDDTCFELVDTGGLGVTDADNLSSEIEKQIERAIHEAQVILFVVDVRSGLMGLDEKVARRLKRVAKPIVCVVNKCDTPELEPQAAEFYRLGVETLVCVSAQHKRGKEELLQQIRRYLPRLDEAPVRDVALKLAIVGRRNTGKSTFINGLAESERVIVSEIPGTTRDSVDVRFERDGKVFVAIDTAGVRRKSSIKGDVEFYSSVRAERSIRRADVVLLFLDAGQTISKVDKQLAGYILEHHKPAIFVVNKWDLLAHLPTEKFASYLRASFPSLDYVPIAFITAKKSRNIYKVLNLAQNLHKQTSARVSTGDLNRVVQWALERQPPPLRQNRRAKIFYATQVATNPPTLILFANSPELFDNTYQRYLLKTFRDHLPFHDVAIKMTLRPKRREDRETERSESATRGEKQAAIARKKKRPTAGKSELWKDL